MGLNSKSNAMGREEWTHLNKTPRERTCEWWGQSKSHINCPMYSHVGRFQCETYPKGHELESLKAKKL